MMPGKTVALVWVDVLALRTNVKLGLRRVSTYIFGIFTLLTAWLFYSGIAAFMHMLQDKLASDGDMAAVTMFTGFLNAVFVMTVFSALINGITALYLERDIGFLLAYPLARASLFIARTIRVVTVSTWFSLMMTVPFVLAFGTALGGKYDSVLPPLLSLLAMGLIATAVGLMLLVFLIRLVPPHRLRLVVTALVIVATLVALLLFRTFNVEDIIIKEDVSSLAAFAAPPSLMAGILPGGLITAMLQSMSNPAVSPGFGIWLWVFFSLVLLWGASHLYRPQDGEGASSGGEKSSRRPRRAERSLPLLTTGTIAWKDVLTFIRTPQYNIQGLFLLSMIAIYLFSSYMLGRQGGNEVAPLLNAMLAGFVISISGVRVLLPLVNAEGRGVWVLVSSPFPLSKMLAAKFRVMINLCLMLAAIFTFSTIFLVPQNGTSIALTAGFLVLISVVSAAGALLFGSIYADFTRLDPSLIVAGMAGILYTVVTSLLTFLLTLLFAYPFFVSQHVAIPKVDLPLSWEAALVLTTLATLITIAFAAVSAYWATSHMRRREW